MSAAFNLAGATDEDQGQIIAEGDIARLYMLHHTNRA
jgi:hypothetical protein